VVITFGTVSYEKQTIRSRQIKRIKQFFRGTIMVHTENSERKKGKPRGRPFPPNNKRGKLKNDVLVSKGPSNGDERGDVAPVLNQSIVEPEINEKSTIENVDELLANGVNEVITENTKTENPKQSNEIVDRIQFENGENTLDILLIKLPNRLYRIQIFLNGKTEIRPVTYTGNSAASAYWNLLRDKLKV